MVNPSNKFIKFQMDQGHAMILLDLQKACDIVDHGIFLIKLEGLERLNY